RPQGEDALAAPPDQREGRPAEEEGHVAAERGAEPQERGGVQRVAVGLVERAQRRRGVARAAAQAGAGGNVLDQPDPHGGGQAGGLVERGGGAVDQVVLGRAQRGAAHLQPDAGFAGGELELVGERERAEHALDLVVAGVLAGQDLEPEIDLGRRQRADQGRAMPPPSGSGSCAPRTSSAAVAASAAWSRASPGRSRSTARSTACSLRLTSRREKPSRQAKYSPITVTGMKLPMWKPMAKPSALLASTPQRPTSPILTAAS